MIKFKMFFFFFLGLKISLNAGGERGRERERRNRERLVYFLCPCLYLNEDIVSAIRERPFSPYCLKVACIVNFFGHKIVHVC